MVDKWLESFDKLEFDRKQMQVVFLIDSDMDSDQHMYFKLLNYARDGKFASYEVFLTGKPARQTYDHATEPRRIRIAQIKEMSKQLIGNSQYVFGLEDDTLCPPDTLKKLVRFMDAVHEAALIEGAEVNRWGFKVMGAWKVDNVQQPTKIATMPYKPTGYDEIDGAGMYCYLTRTKLYKDAHYHNEQSPFGVDVNYGFDLRKAGWKCFIDWSIKCEHYYLKGLVDKPRVLVPDETVAVAEWELTDGKWELAHPVGARQ